MVYEFKKGELNKFNDLNQDLKTVFSTFFLYGDGCVLGESVLHKGKHFAYTNFKMFFEYPEDVILKFNSQAIFKAISDNKKNIKAISIVDNSIFLIGDSIDPIIIGDVINVNLILENTSEDIMLFHRILNRDSHGVDVVQLTTDDVHRLVKNEFINITQHKYRTRITREVVPGLKKSHELILDFCKHDTDKTLFHLIIKSIRKSCVTYHWYTCLFM